MRRSIRFAIAFAILLACAAAEAKLVAAPGEQIVSFIADVTVNSDATLTVCEDFVVRSEGSYFKYGFTRQLPIDDEARWDERYAGKWQRDNGIRVRILEVTENGAPVTYEQGSGFGYPQLRIGSRDVPLAPGDHHYVIRYIVDGAIGLGTARDTLYWNAIGHYWDLPVPSARVIVHLPISVPPAGVRSEPRIGGRGVSDNAGAPQPLAEPMEAGSPGTAYSATNLRPRQSPSVVVTWPAGAVQNPRLAISTRDRIYLAAPLALCLYYLVAWLAIGRAPRQGTVVVRYEPPPGISAAAARYLLTTGSDGRTLAAVIASLAARDCLRVEARDGLYRLTRLAPNPAEEGKLAPEEKHALQFLFEDGPTAEISPSMSQENSLRNSRYVANIQQDLAKRLDGLYFTRHLGYIAFGVLATFVAALSFAATAHGRDPNGALFMTIWILICAMILGVIAETGFIPAWKDVLRGTARWSKLMPGSAAFGVFLLVIAYLLRQMAQGISPAYAVMVAALALVNLIWAPFLKRMTPEGRSALDAISGFRQFLESVEQDRLHRLNAAAPEPDAGTEYLPFAIALEVREAWGDHLAEAFFATTIQR